MAKKFELIDHTADIGIAAYGADLKEAFANAAYALFSLMVDLDDVRECLCREARVTADNREDLLVEWLNELIYIFDVDNLLLKRFEITRLTDKSLRADCFGEKIDPQRHRIKMGIKAATYHMLRVEEGNGWRAQVLLDI
jgi:SHS2 domain-containing protein